MSGRDPETLREQAKQLRSRGLQYCDQADAAGPGQSRGMLMGMAVLCRDAAIECEAEALQLECPAGHG
jgi:hypothetical protein